METILMTTKKDVVLGSDLRFKVLRQDQTVSYIIIASIMSCKNSETQIALGDVSGELVGAERKLQFTCKNDGRSRTNFVVLA